MDWSAHQKELTEAAGLLGWEQITAIADRVAGILATHSGTLEARLREARFGPADVGGEDGAVVPVPMDSEAVRNLMAQAMPAVESKALMLEQRARAAEASQQALLAAGAEFQERLQAVEADRDGWKVVALRALVLNVLVRAQWERYVLAAAGHPIDGCPGTGKCHGSLTWCCQCGDVALLCDMSGRCDLHRDRWLEHILERAPVAKFAREEGYAAGRREAEAERLKEVEELRARLRRARSDAWREAVDAVIGAPLISEEAHEAMAPVRAHVAALLKVAGAVESAIADIAENGTGADCMLTSQAHAKELLAIIRAKHPGAEWLARADDREQSVQPFLALARDRIRRISHEPIAMEDCRRLLAAFNASPVEEQNG